MFGATLFMFERCANVYIWAEADLLEDGFITCHRLNKTHVRGSYDHHRLWEEIYSDNIWKRNTVSYDDKVRERFVMEAGWPSKRFR